MDRVRGTNNGTWGFGMIGAFFPNSLNGPLGYNNYPLPNDNSSPTRNSPAYNSSNNNSPAYNVNYFKYLGRT